MIEGLPVSRGEARALDAKLYFTGKRCPKEHVAPRRTHNGECVECGRSSSRERSRLVPKDVKSQRDATYRERNSDGINSRRKARYAANPSKYRSAESEARWNSGGGKEYKRKWTEDNRPRLNELGRAWKRANAEQVRDSKAEYYRLNPHVAVIAQQRRRALVRGAEGHFTKEDIQCITDAQGGLCATPGCSNSGKLTIDHIKPLSRGGSNWPSNIQMLCLTCNCTKRDKDNDEFMAHLASAA